jgi:spore maturation protein CgeB
MKVAIFAHSFLSDWNHGNAHFLRGIVTELSSRGHEVRCYEPADGWSIRNLVRDHGTRWLVEVPRVYPALRVIPYLWPRLDLDHVLDGVDLVLVHEWNAPSLVAALGKRRARGGHFRLLFHDTHHRAVTAPAAMAEYDLEAYDGVLAFGEALREVYAARGWGRCAWTWHEAADARVFHPRLPGGGGDLIWIGNWGDDERTVEMREFLLDPVQELGLSLRMHGVRYPAHARRNLRRRGVRYMGWLPNFHVPAALARHRVTVHVPRRPYARALPGIPTIRPFEAMACGIPLVCAPWHDTEGLFRPGVDHLVARSGGEMRRHLRAVLHDPGLARALSHAGWETIRQRHTCGHRVDGLLDILASLGLGTATTADPLTNRPLCAGVG